MKESPTRLHNLSLYRGRVLSARVVHFLGHPRVPQNFRCTKAKGASVMDSSVPAQSAPNPGLVFEMLMAHQRSAALKAAIDLDVFRAIGEGPGDIASIARQCSSSERGMRVLCDFLVISGVLTKDGAKYSHTPTSAVFLDPRSPASLASVAQFLGNQAMADPYDVLADVVRAGRTTLPGEGSVEPDNPIWVQFAETMEPMMGP